MRNYNLGFISDENIFKHVQETVTKYRRSINLKEFNENIIDPIKMTFDAKIYGQSVEESIIQECIRQIDKSNNNCIGYFHQRIFNFAEGWQVPKNGEQGGFDVINEDLNIYAEIKNKHNTMNSSSQSSTYIKMQDKILKNSKATCYLVEVIAKKSQNITWEVSLKRNNHKEKYKNDKIRRISIDKFYEIVFGDSKAFIKLCKALPLILDDVINENISAKLKIEVLEELDKTDFYKSLFLLAFSKYEGFDNY